MFLRYFLFLLLMLVTTCAGCYAQTPSTNAVIDSTKLKEFYNYIKWTYNYGAQKEFDSTKRYSNRALVLAKELQNQNLIAFAKISASHMLYWQLKTKEARVLLNENIAHGSLHDSIKFETYLLLGEIDIFERRYKEAANHLVDGERLIEHKGITTKRDSSDYVFLNLNFAELYKNLKDYPKAHLYYDKAFNFYGDKNESSYVLYYKSGLFQKENEIKSAINALKSALKLIDDKPNGKLFLPTYCLRLSEIYLDLKKPDSAAFYAKQGLYKNEDCKLDELHMAVGDAYFMENKYALASNHYGNALEVSGSKNFEMKIHEKLRDVHTELKDFKNALTHNELFLKLKDSIVDLKIEQEVTEITEKYESNKKQIEIEKLKIDELESKVLIDKQKEKLTFISIGLASSVLIVGLIFFSYLRQKKQRHLLFMKNVQLAQELELSDTKNNQSNINPIEITDSKRSTIQLQIERLITNDFYLDQEMSLPKMAKLIETNTTYLSKIINDDYNKPFSSFINNLRISYTLKSLEANPDFRKLTIEHIAEKSGFSSASAFYNAFKKETGLTPSYYIKKRMAQ